MPYPTSLHQKGPTLLLDEQKAKSHIQFMKKKGQQTDTQFRPHFKTHQSAAIGHWFREAGIRSITVSSLPMAQYFAQQQWEDILLAFPVNINQLPALHQLAQQVHLGLLVDHPDAARQLAQHFTSPVRVWIDVDVGDQRSGVPWDDPSITNKVLQPLMDASPLKIQGLLAHAGHTYQATSQKEIVALYHRMVQRLHYLRQNINLSSPSLTLSIGDTPTASVVEDFKNIDEFRPGNFIFYDLMQAQTGACQFDDIALCLACPIVGKYSHRQELVIHGGAIHLSKEILQENSLPSHFGKVVPLTDKGWGPPYPQTFVRSLSQEHGVISCSPECFNSVTIGEYIGILPVHACLTAHLMGTFHTLTGKTFSTFTTATG